MEQGMKKLNWNNLPYVYYNLLYDFASKMCK